jgi:uroporphyrinogen-III synthase
VTSGAQVPPQRARGPLADVGVIVTRPARQSAALAQRLATFGARPIVWPAIVILPPDDGAPLARAHAHLADYDLAVFVSANAVEFGAPDPARWPASVRIYAPGIGTAEAITAVGLPEARVPETSFDSEGLLALPELAHVEGRRVVIFRGDEGRALLGDTLSARGAIVDYVACYRRAAPATSSEGLLRVLAASEAHALTLTSIEGLTNLLDAIGARGKALLAQLKTFAPHARIVAAAREAGLDAFETPPGDAGLLTALLEWFTQHPIPSRAP